jgi:hypothetical protein
MNPRGTPEAQRILRLRRALADQAFLSGAGDEAAASIEELAAHETTAS